MPKRRGLGKGWWLESERHRLARMGIKTGRKLHAIAEPTTITDDSSFRAKLQHTFNLTKEEAHKLAEEIKENAPKAWAWIKKESAGVAKKGKKMIEKAKEKYKERSEAQKEIEAMSDAELKEKAIRWKRNITLIDAIFTTDSNPYEEELLRRITKRKELEKKIRAIKKSK